MICSVFLVCIIGRASGSFDYSGRATLEDVFFNTDERIAVFQRSYSRTIEGHDPVCIYNTKMSLTNTTLSLQQHYYLYYDTYTPPIKGDDTIYWRINGTGYFVYMNLSKEPGMDVSPVLLAWKYQDESNTRKYYFDYYDPLDKCAVITFSDDPCSLKCELLVWERYIWSSKVNCDREYEYYCGKSTCYRLYDKFPCPGIPKRP
ncbi:uncharacterized protein LOC119396066 isoform X2 [Rhipicephalus sanguineus]|uniref:uncharacterized protein LOC119396066 isoform X2 n=1 Tax=Rhipicephalus sanguineus TaxID=34632 RepID=UPI0018958F19|nr:uncharacterized protein LOC119396066 isoform X2 [Rhipicephalus sanguineus]